MFFASIAALFATSRVVVRTKSKRFAYKPGKIMATFLLTPERQKDYEDAVAAAQADRKHNLEAERTAYEEALTKLHETYAHKVDGIEHQCSKTLHDLYVRHIVGVSSGGGPNPQSTLILDRVAA